MGIRKAYNELRKAVSDRLENNPSEAVASDAQGNGLPPEEDFAMVTIEEPQADADEIVQQSAPTQARGFNWPKFSLRRQPKEAPPLFAIPEGEEILMVDAKQALEALNVWGAYQAAHIGDGRIDAYSLLTLTRKLNELGLDVVPDGRCPFRVKVGDEFAIFHQPEKAQPPLTYRSVQQTVIYLAAWLIQTDTVTAADLALIDGWIDDNTPKDRSPLPQKGMLRWLLSRKRILSKRVKTRAASQMARFVHKRASALSLLLQLAALSPQSQVRIKNLEKIFPLFGLEASDVHVEMHRHATESHPGKSKKTATAAPTATLDKARLQQIEQNTLKTQQMLHEVFADDAAEDIPAAIVAEKSKNAAEALYNKVREREEWSVDDFKSLAAEHGLSPMAALEEVNDYSYEINGEPILEEDGDALIVCEI